MKKNYYSPEISIVTIELNQMVAASILDSNEGSPSVEVSSEGFGGTFGSRGGSWDDED